MAAAAAEDDTAALEEGVLGWGGTEAAVEAAQNEQTSTMKYFNTIVKFYLMTLLIMKSPKKMLKCTHTPSHSNDPLTDQLRMPPLGAIPF